jgi:hypothetical protein
MDEEPNVARMDDDLVDGRLKRRGEIATRSQSIPYAHEDMFMAYGGVSPGRDRFRSRMKINSDVTALGDERKRVYEWSLRIAETFFVGSEFRFPWTLPRLNQAKNIKRKIRYLSRRLDEVTDPEVKIRIMTELVMTKDDLKKAA